VPVSLCRRLVKFNKGGPVTAVSVKAWDIMPSNPY